MYTCFRVARCVGWLLITTLVMQCQGCKNAEAVADRGECTQEHASRPNHASETQNIDVGQAQQDASHQKECPAPPLPPAEQDAAIVVDDASALDNVSSFSARPHWLYTSENMDVTCCICLEDVALSLFEPKCNACLKWFHRGCLRAWIAQNDRCPMCREKFSLRVWMIYNDEKFKYFHKKKR